MLLGSSGSCLCPPATVKIDHCQGHLRAPRQLYALPEGPESVSTTPEKNIPGNVLAKTQETFPPST